jgi:hypothetical protein
MSRPLRLVVAALGLAGWLAPARAQCPEQQVQLWTGAVSTVCPCFVAGEQMGTVFASIPPSHYPIEILRVGIGWGSTGCQVGLPFPDQLEDAIHVYNADLAGLIGGAAPLATLSGPVLQDCAINEYDLTTQLPMPVIVNAGPVAVTLQFLQASSPTTGPAPGFDTGGCTSPRNVIFGIPGGWQNSCSLGVPGDWQVHLVYRPVNCSGSAFCFGSNGACPCGNGGAPMAGCDNPQATGGARLDFTGFSPNGSGGGSATITGTGFPAMSSPTVVGLRSPSPQLIPPVFGDGLLCIGAGGLVRFGATTAVGGSSTHAFSHGAGAGTFYYQLWYRSTPSTFCDPFAAFNLSNGWELAWP